MRINMKIVIFLVMALLLADDLRAGGIFPQQVYCDIGDGISTKSISGEKIKANPLGADIQKALMLSNALGLMLVSGTITEADYHDIMEGRKPFCLKLASVLKYAVSIVSNRPMSDGWSVFESK